jgi:N6-L-threonylcarbamoyladenine synthase
MIAEMISQLGGELFFPRIEFCTDNGAMIAQVGCFRLMAGETQPLEIDARARWPMQDLRAI